MRRSKLAAWATLAALTVLAVAMPRAARGRFRRAAGTSAGGRNRWRLGMANAGDGTNRLFVLDQAREDSHHS